MYVDKIHTEEKQCGSKIYIFPIIMCDYETKVFNIVNVLNLALSER